MIFLFGEFRLDTRLLELHHDGNPVHIEPQAFDVLRLLIENRDRVVGKDELLDHVWQGRIVSEASIGSCINAVRRAVDDDGKRQETIHTLPRRGFRFVQPLRALDEAPSPGVTDKAELEETNFRVTGGKPVSSVLGRPAVAVLPFENLSGDPEQEYFADGLTEDIITALSLWRYFPVISRNSTFVYKGKSRDIRKVGDELGARYVIEGSVRKSDSRVRVTAQLIDAELDHHIWAERYDRELEDIFEVQDDVTRRIVATLSPELARSEQKRSARSQPQDLKAWDYLQRGTFYSYQFSKEGSELGREMFQNALDIDPSYARAFAEIAFSHAVDLGLGHAASGGDTMSELSKAAREAVRLDPSDSMAQLMLSFAYAWTDQYDLSISTVERAIDLNPSYARALGHLGTMLDLTGRHDAGITGLRDSLRLNPNEPFMSQWHLTFLARALVAVRRYEEAVEAARKAISVRATHLPAHYILAVALGHLDRQSEAQAALAQCEREQPGFVQERTEWRPYRDEARNDHILEGLRKADWTG